MKYIFLFLYTIFGLYSICSTNLTYTNYNACYNMHTERIIEALFQNENCVSMIRLCNDQPEIVNILYKIPKLVKKISIFELKPNYNLTIRPRRDLFDRKKTINSLCSENSHSYIIIVKNIEELLIYMFSEMVIAFWSPQSIFFIYFVQENCGSNMKPVFENLWRVYKTPQVVITGCACNTILFYNPFLGNDTNRGAILNFTYEEVRSDPNLIVNSMLDFNKYPVKSIIFKSLYLIPQTTGFIGIDNNLLNLMAKRLNFTSLILFPFDDNAHGFKMPNGTFTGALKRLLDGDADCIAVHYFIKDYLTIDIEFGASSVTDKLCVIMRKADRIPEWQLIYYCLDKFTWILIVVTYFVMAFSWILIQKLVMFRDEAVLHPYIFTDTFRLMITSAIYRLPSTTSERILLAFCMVAFVTLVGAFQGALIEVFATPMFYKDLNTLEELSRSDTQIISKYLYFIDDIFTDITLPLIAKLKSMTSYYDDNDSITKRIVTHNNIATIIRKSEVEISNTTTGFYDEEYNYNLIHMVKECARTYSLAHLFPVNSPYAPRFSKLTLRIAEAGFFVKWYDEMVFNSSSAASTDDGHGLTDAITVFSMEDMQIAFFQLSFGLLLAWFVFLIEVCAFVSKRNGFPEYISDC